jgi:hypothetical protein
MTAAPPIDLDNPVTEWQVKQYKLQGFNERQIAIMLVDRCFDHHDTEHLLKRGMSHEQVIAITRG